MSLKTLKWYSILSPAVAAGAIEILRHRYFVEKDPMIVGNLIIFGVLLVMSFFLARFTFGIIEKTQKENARRNQELASINSVATAVNQSLKLDVVLYRALDKLLQITGAQAGEILLVNEQTGRMERKAASGHISEQDYEKTDFHTAEGFHATILKGEPVVTAMKPVPAQISSGNKKKIQLDYMVGVPLRSKDEIIGAIVISAAQHQPFTHEDTQLLVNIGNQVVVAIINARLHEKVQDIAALEERERIARELHDGIAQVLSYVNAKAQAAQQVLANGEQAQAGAYLKELEGVARECYSDVREAILGLRSTDLFQNGLVSTLKEYVSRLSQLSNIEIGIEINHDVAHLLPANVELQMIRIIQEALNNVRKHARAVHAMVRIISSDDKVITTIEDDGQGFEPARTRRENRPQFGIQTMRERAESVNGSLDIASVPGKGTRVTLLIPVQVRAEV